MILCWLELVMLRPRYLFTRKVKWFEFQCGENSVSRLYLNNQILYFIVRINISDQR